MKACVFGAVAFSLALGFSACGSREPRDAYTSIQAPAADMLGDFKSYESISTVRAQLPADADVTVVEDARLDEGDSRPRFDRYALGVKGYVHLGHSGELRLEFFNDRLSQTTFDPDDYNSYLTALRASGVSAQDEFSQSGPFAEVWTARDFNRRSYVAWRDTRLRDESMRWIGRYS